MTSSEKRFDCGKSHTIRYSVRNNHLNDATIYKKNRKNYINNEIINSDFLYVSNNIGEEMVKNSCHIEM